jgi:hypothetical protein
LCCVDSTPTCTDSTCWSRRRSPPCATGCIQNREGEIRPSSDKWPPHQHFLHDSIPEGSAGRSLVGNFGLLARVELSSAFRVPSSAGAGALILCRLSGWTTGRPGPERGRRPSVASHPHVLAPTPHFSLGGYLKSVEPRVGIWPTTRIRFVEERGSLHRSSVARWSHLICSRQRDPLQGPVQRPRWRLSLALLL